eukprot:5569567-Pyramimonas_sp.AAC.1
MTPEIRYRASTTVSSLQVLRRRVFATDQLALQRRLSLADSLVMSGRQCTGGAWPSLKPAEAKLAHIDHESMPCSSARTIPGE